MFYDQAILDTTTYGMTNMLYNYGLEKANYAMTMMTQRVMPQSFAEYLDPNLAIKQANFKWNTGMAYGCGAFTPVGNSIFGGMNMPGFNSSLIPGFNGFNLNGTVTPGSNNNSGGSVETKAVNTYTEIFNRLKSNNLLNDEVINAYNEAMKKSSASEKLAALREVFKNIEPQNIKNAILNNSDIKKELEALGYYFADGKEDSSVKLPDTIQNLLNSICDETNASFGRMASIVRSEGNIIKVLSQWNNGHNGDADRNIIRYVANNMNKQDVYREGIVDFVTALLNQADKFSSSEQIRTKKAALSQKLQAVTTAYDTPNNQDGVKDAILALAPDFDALYAQIRVQIAAKADSMIQDKYGKEFNEAIADCIPATMIYNETKADLEAEGISSVPAADEIKTSNGYVTPNSSTSNKLDSDFKNDPEGKLEASATAEYGDLTVKTDYEGVYKSNTGDNVIPVYYTVVNGKIVVLKNVESIDGEGKCKLFDGTEAALSELIADSNNIQEVSTDKLSKMKETSAKIDDLIAKDKIKEKSNLQVNGMKVYYATEKDENDNWRYFIVKDGELVKLNDVKGNMDANGNIKLGDKTVNIKDLSAGQYKKASENDYKAVIRNTVKIKDLALISSDDLDIADEQAEEKGFKKAKLSGYYYKSNNGKTRYFAYQNGTFKELEGVKSINENGQAVLTSGKKVALKDIASSAFSAGKSLRKALYGNTSDEEYAKAKRKLNSFFTYTDVKDIYNFVKGYNTEKDPLCFYHSKLAAQIVTEYGLEDDEKQEYLKQIAKKVKLMAQKIHIDDEELMEDLQEIADNGEIEASIFSTKHFWRNLWYSNADDLVKTAKLLDHFTEVVMEAYEAKLAGDLEPKTEELNTQV